MVALVLLIPTLTACQARAQMLAGPEREGDPVLVELFTSQGCSSCPPADTLLRQLDKRKDVIPLAFHVDYWNDLGWQDPFSSPKWTNRQRRYARSFEDNRIYTPQLVVHGRAHTVGSAASRVRRAIHDVKDPSLKVTLDATTSWNGEQLTLDITSQAAAAPDEPLQLLVAVYENGLVTQVPRGENAGRQLTNDRIVRRLQSIGTLDSAKAFAEKVDVKLDPSWQQVGAVLFVQGTKSMAIYRVKALGERSP